MTLQIRKSIVGPLENNTYLIWESETNESCLIDPGIGSIMLTSEIKENGLVLKYILLTHAHFDHITDAHRIANAFAPSPKIGLHPLDKPLWESGGGAKEFGFQLDLGPLPNYDLEKNSLINLGKYKINIIHTPGHTPGHVVFHIASEKVVFSGDLIFFHGVGRTDFNGGDHQQLLESIHMIVYTHPEETRILSGHGSDTTIREEKLNNPFLNS